MTGVVTKIEWTNPHCHFYVDVVDERGTVVNWKFEGYGIGPLYRNGWKRDVTMKAGDRVTVTGWRARDGGPWAHSREITLANGQKMFQEKCPARAKRIVPTVATTMFKTSAVGFITSGARPNSAIAAR